MTIERWMIKKWTKITLFCGAHSFFWGAMGGGSIIAMIAGLVTLILLFSAIESHPAYQAKRSGNALFARAVDIGIKIRMYFTILVIASLILLTSGIIMVRPNHAIYTLISFPYVAELWIGMGASLACTWLTGTSVEMSARSADYTRSALPVPVSSLDNIIATYTTTIITGVLHTFILAVLCGVVYFVLRLRRKKAA